MSVEVHTLVEGPPDAPVVVMSHSLGVTLEMWQPQAEVLARSFRVVRYDLRGHGRSPVPPGPYEIADLGGDVVALLDRLGVAHAHLCGLSLGGMVSLWVAAHHPRRVARLVVCCTSAVLGPPELWIDRAAAVRAGGTVAVADAILARWFTPEWRAGHPDRIAALRATIAATPAEGYAACCGAIQRMDLRADLPRIRAPTVAVAATADPSTPPEYLRRIVERIRGARLALVDHAAHLANLEQPERVSELILAHLQDDRAPPERGPS